MQTLTIPASVSKRKQACQNCRHRKKKCDAGRPACALCRKWGTSCIYDASLRTQRDDNFLPNYETRAPPSIQAVASLASADSSHLGLLEMMQPNGPDADIAVPVALRAYPTPDSSTVLGDSADQQDLFADLQLPAHDLLMELVGLFFDNVGHLFPCFHRQRLNQEIHEGKVQDACPMLLFAIGSMACRYHSNPAVKVRQQDWYNQATLSFEFTQRHLHSPLRTIQAVLVLLSHGYTTGDFSASCLGISKVWKQVVTLGLNRLDANCDAATGQGKHDGTTVVDKDELRRTLWLLFITERNQAWPTGSPSAIPELHFKIDLPITNELFQAMDPKAESGPVDNIPFTRNFTRLIASIAPAEDAVNVYAYICVAYVLLGRVSDLIHSLHASPNSAEYAEDCEELDAHLVRLLLRLPRQATSILEARPTDRGHVIWLRVVLETSTMLLHYRCSTGVPADNVPSPLMLAVAAARNIVQVVKDASRISTGLLMSPHIVPSLYVAACILLIEWRTTGNQSYKDDVDLLALVFDRMNEVFVFLGLKFKLALEHDLKRSNESVADLRQRGLRGLLVDCSKWSHVKEEVERRGLLINIT